MLPRTPSFCEARRIRRFGAKKGHQEGQTEGGTRGKQQHKGSPDRRWTKYAKILGVNKQSSVVIMDMANESCHDTRIFYIRN